ncbi:hypothetical protein SCHPADRAFT_897356 [Schizopora paradoxa]|uniref:Uncharacterized protein n=1 Tax=Schizopora paradoxa TaxID=27342 RepID=A0A0H2QYI8_9AGAM|nr:hypothetical protein SCHPADRAFT_897356 [Schizopora paradoxa]
MQGRAATRSPAFDTSRRRLLSAGPRSTIDGGLGAAWTMRDNVERTTALRDYALTDWPRRELSMRIVNAMTSIREWCSKRRGCAASRTRVESCTVDVQYASAYQPNRKRKRHRQFGIGGGGVSARRKYEVAINSLRWDASICTITSPRSTQPYRPSARRRGDFHGIRWAALDRVAHQLTLNTFDALRRSEG